MQAERTPHSAQQGSSAQQQANKLNNSELAGRLKTLTVRPRAFERTRRGNLLRTTAELSDEKKWRLVEMPAPASPSSQTELLPLPEGIRGR